jgi:hypothetical protein
LNFCQLLTTLFSAGAFLEATENLEFVYIASSIMHVYVVHLFHEPGLAHDPWYEAREAESWTEWPQRNPHGMAALMYQQILSAQEPSLFAHSFLYVPWLFSQAEGLLQRCRAWR